MATNAGEDVAIAVMAVIIMVGGTLAWRNWNAGAVAGRDAAQNDAGDGQPAGGIFQQLRTGIYACFGNRWWGVALAVLWVILLGVILGAANQAYSADGGWLVFLQLLMMVVVPTVIFFRRKSGEIGGQCAEAITIFEKQGAFVAWIVAIMTMIFLNYSKAGNHSVNTFITAILIIVGPILALRLGKAHSAAAAAGRAAQAQAAQQQGEERERARRAQDDALQADLVGRVADEMERRRAGAAVGGGHNQVGGAPEPASPQRESALKLALGYSTIVALITALIVLLITEADKYPLLGKSVQYILYAASATFLIAVGIKLLGPLQGLRSVFGVDSVWDIFRIPSFAVKVIMAELLFAGLVTYFPSVKKELMKFGLPSDCKVFLSEPTSLSSINKLAPFWKLNDQTADAYPSKSIYNYSVGGWFFFNSIASSAPASEGGFYTILDCAGAPVYEWNSSSGVLKVSANMQNGGNAVLFEDKVPLQRWNNIMVSFSGGTADVYINNTLVGTRDDVTPTQSHGSLIVGTESRSGSPQGGAANIVYCPKAIGPYTVDLNYRITAPEQGV